MSRRRWHVLVVAAALVVLSACAAGPNTRVGTGAESGFLLGLWQGAISPITFVISLFDDHVAIYEVHNSGHWYDFGFLLGASAAFSGAARSGTARSGAARSGTAPSRARRGRGGPQD